MNSTIDLSLSRVDELLVKMGQMCVDALQKSSNALHDADQKLAQTIKNNDKQINNLQSQIDEICVTILLREQPFARDLRHVIAAIKMVTDMERIGDQAANIADIVLVSDFYSKLEVVNIIEEMADKACKMVEGSIRAFILRDIHLTRKIIHADDEIDVLYAKARVILEENLKIEGTKNRAIDSVMIAKYLERIADHATNVAEWVEFSITGVHPSYEN